MIKLTRLSNEMFVLNSDLIEYVEVDAGYRRHACDNRKKMRVSKSADEIISKVMEFRRACQCPRLINDGQ